MVKMNILLSTLTLGHLPELVPSLLSLCFHFHFTVKFTPEKENNIVTVLKNSCLCNSKLFGVYLPFSYTVNLL